MTHNPDIDDKPTAPENRQDTEGRAEPQDQQDADRAQASRKERVLHTRVPAVLELELKRLAQSWRVPVSNVVRAILEDAVAAVDVVGRRAEGNLHHVVDRLAEQRERLRTITQPPEQDQPGRAGQDGSAQAGERESAPAERGVEVLEGIIGFQPLKLATKTTCSRCGRAMRAGEEAYLGVREGPGPRVLIGAECLPAADENEDEAMEDQS